MSVEARELTDTEIARVGLRAALQALDRQHDHPYGPPGDDSDRRTAGGACIDLCGGDRDKAIVLWREIERDLGGYVPRAAQVALIRASRARDLIVPGEAPEVS